ncbi:hypothetical protein SCLCIDRAFT_113568 [Scleroderma citrinum Foug A]|uniref:DUF6532 domain-containing protein n=1 Tax=Scleroderma citrinum Foug A TaxID=1036808 RepID=A0A0C3EB26_9AGAM|nr:hypothetical protein SCLCIDRAFT_113568 [Scleroderma citrinum Foug A]
MVFEDVKPKSSSSQALSIVSVSGLTTQGVLLSSLKTLEGCSSFMIQVLSCGHTAFCLYIATVDGFPPGSANIEKSWTCLQEGIKGSMDLKVELSKIGQDTILKGKTINYVTAASQIQGELVGKAHQRISSSYSIPRTMKAQEVASMVEWLIKTGAFLDRELNIQVKSYQPFSHPIIKDLIINQWFGSKGEGIKYASTFRDISNALLTLVAAVVECALWAYITGVKATHPNNFSSAKFQTCHQYYHMMLQCLQKNCLTWMTNLKKELYHGTWVALITCSRMILN